MSQVIKCDGPGCTQIGDNKFVPYDWYTLSQVGGYPQHFCSDTCLQNHVTPPLVGISEAANIGDRVTHWRRTVTAAQGAAPPAPAGPTPDTQLDQVTIRHVADPFTARYGGPVSCAWDGNAYRILFGDNLQVGKSFWGATPEQAVTALLTETLHTLFARMADTTAPTLRPGLQRAIDEIKAVEDRQRRGCTCMSTECYCGAIPRCACDGPTTTCGACG